MLAQPAGEHRNSCATSAKRSSNSRSDAQAQPQVVAMLRSGEQRLLLRGIGHVARHVLRRGVRAAQPHPAAGLGQIAHHRLEQRVPAPFPSSSATQARLHASTRRAAPAPTLAAGHALQGGLAARSPRAGASVLSPSIRLHAIAAPPLPPRARCRRRWRAPAPTPPPSWKLPSITMRPWCSTRCAWPPRPRNPGRARPAGNTARSAATARQHLADVGALGLLRPAVGSSSNTQRLQRQHHGQFQRLLLARCGSRAGPGTDPVPSCAALQRGAAAAARARAAARTGARGWPRRCAGFPPPSCCRRCWRSGMRPSPARTQNAGPRAVWSGTARSRRPSARRRRRCSASAWSCPRRSGRSVPAARRRRPSGRCLPAPAGCRSVGHAAQVQPGAFRRRRPGGQRRRGRGGRAPPRPQQQRQPARQQQDDHDEGHAQQQLPHEGM